MHTPMREQHGWLARVLRGHYAYYGVTGNSHGLRRFLAQALSGPGMERYGGAGNPPG